MSNVKLELEKLLARQEQLAIKQQNHGLDDKEEAEFKDIAKKIPLLTTEAENEVLGETASTPDPKANVKTRQKKGSAPKKDTESATMAMLKAMEERMDSLAAENKLLHERLAEGSSMPVEELKKDWREIKEIKLPNYCRFRVFTFGDEGDKKFYPIGLKFKEKMKTAEGEKEYYIVTLMDEEGAIVEKVMDYKAFTVNPEIVRAEIISFTMRPVYRETGYVPETAYEFYKHNGEDRVRLKYGEMVPLRENKERRIYKIKLPGDSGAVVELTDNQLNI